MLGAAGAFGRAVDKLKGPRPFDPRGGVSGHFSAVIN